MSSPQTPVKELTYPTVSQDLIDRADAREKKKYEELKQHVMEVFQRGKTEIQQDRENWLATLEEKQTLERAQEHRRRSQGLSVKWGVLSNRLSGAEHRAVFSCGAISRCSTPRTTFARSTSSGSSTSS